MEPINFVEITHENASAEGLFCIKNPQYPGFKLKLDWLEKRRAEGLKLKILKNGRETVGFVEYVPGEFAWRPVKADNYLFIHCLWVYPKKNLGKGFGSILLEEVENDARSADKAGVTVVTSEGTWMSGPSLFRKNGFKETAVKDRFILMTKKLNPSPDPEFRDWEKNLANYRGLNLVYANQCPLFIKSVDDMKQTASAAGLDLKVTVLNSAEDIRNAASGYGVYSLVYEGRLLADHYISNTRFKNILNKEIVGK